jgi:translation initiation factor IF-2
MSDGTDTDGKKTLSLGSNKLSLNKAPAARAGGDAGSVKQSFSHGRSKTVAVEVKRKRASDGGMEGTDAPAAPAGNVALQQRGRSTSAVLQNLTKEERDARERALRGAIQDEKRRSEEAALQEEQNVAEEPATASAASPEPEAVVAAEPAEPQGRGSRLLSPLERRTREMEELRRIQEQERQAAEEAERRRKEEEVKRQESGRQESGRQETGRKDAGGMRSATIPSPKRDGAAATTAAPAAPGAPANRYRDDDDDGQGRRKAGPGGNKPGTRAAPTPDRRRTGGKMQLTRALDGDDNVRTRSMASMRRAREREKRQMNLEDAPKFAREIIIPEVLTVQELANRMAERGADVIKALMKMGVMATITQSIDADTAELVVSEFGHKPKRVSESDVEMGIAGNDDTAEHLISRPPVVTVMGHVDHGKTSLLDALRSTRVASGEAGGITQHIGAYQVTLPEGTAHAGQKVTFIDTPGHAAFTAMRARGANVTDIVVLVVAADDGVMPQTIEAIKHAKAAGAPIIVAINKIDLPTANPTRVRQELLQHDIQVEDMGGETLDVEVSAKARKNLDKLLDAILLQAEILDLKANPDRAASGVVVEAKMERGRGAVASLLVQKGTLKTGDVFVIGAEWGRVRALVNDHGKTVPQAGPAVPVEVLGLNGVPLAGDDFAVVESESRAREISEFRQRKKRTAVATVTQRGSLEQMFSKIQAGEIKELPVVIKGDVQGSVEAIKGSLEKLTIDNTEVRVRVLDATVGAVSESDITLATASKALIIGFNVRANPQARDLAKANGVEIRYYSIIYNIIDDVKAALSGMLSPTMKENFLGYAQVLQVFNITKVGKVAGCRVTEGVVKRGAGVRLLRDNVVIHEGKLKTLKRMKDEVKEVKEGYECGMAFENYDNIQDGDVIEAFEVEEVARQL